MTQEITLTRYAQLNGSTIVQVIESDTDPDGTNGDWVACGGAGPGWGYDGEAFHAPVVIEPLAPRILTKLEFLRLFTQAERIAIRAAAKVDATVEDFMLLLDLADHVDKDDPDVMTGVLSMAAGTLLATGRAEEILA